jgi:hypothetical protein
MLRCMDEANQLLVRVSSLNIERVPGLQDWPPFSIASGLERLGVKAPQHVPGYSVDVNGEGELRLQIEVWPDEDLTQQARIIEQVRPISTTVTGYKGNVVERRFIRRSSKPGLHVTLPSLAMLTAGAQS